MADRSPPFDEEELLDHVRGGAPKDLSDRIEAEMARDPMLAAEIALMRGLEPALAGTAPANPPGELGWKRLESEIRRDQARTPPPATRRPAVVWRAAAVVCGLLVLGQGAYIASVVGTGDAPAFRTATAPDDRYGLGVVFAPEATAAELETLLREVAAQIADGPSALGLYSLVFETEAALAAGRARLETSRLVALVAEQ